MARHYEIRRRSGIGRNLFDFLMVILTGGVWLIWLIIKKLND